MSTIDTRIAELRESDPEISVKKLRAFLTIDDHSAKDITEAFKRLEISTERKSFKKALNERLVEAPMTEEEFDKFLEEEGSENDIRQKASRKMTWKLAQDIRQALAESTED